MCAATAGDLYMQIHEAKQDDVLIVSVQGQLDTVTATSFENRLLRLIDTGEHRICIDCAALSYVNSAGLKALLIAAKQLDTVKGRLALCALAPNVRMIFEMIGFAQIMTIVPTREDALRYLAGEPTAPQGV